MAASESGKAIEQELKTRKIKRDVDVKELYLAKQSLIQVEDLSKFRNLKILWLNGNKFRRVECLRDNLRLSELYLQHNAITDISDCLQHLTCLHTLMLHNNQLQHLVTVVTEFKKMHNLKVLNLFNNPIAQESEYRVYVVHHVPSLQILDRHEVQKGERDCGRQLYDQEREIIRETVAFGRRSEGPPNLYYPREISAREPTRPVDFDIGNNFNRSHHTYSSEEEAVHARTLRRSLMEYSFFDWAKVPRATERRLSGKPFDNPQVITTRFR